MFEACEYEDSTNCIWDAQKQGNGEGNSFVDIDGSVHYVTDTTVYEDVWTDEGITFPYQYVWGEENGEPYMVIIWEGEETLDCPENTVPGWLDEHGNATSCVDDHPNPLEPRDKGEFVGELDNPEPIELVLEPVEEITEQVVSHPSGEIKQPELLAETGIGIELGIIAGALIAIGAWITIKGRK